MALLSVLVYITMSIDVKSTVQILSSAGICTHGIVKAASVNYQGKLSSLHSKRGVHRMHIL